ncbi:MAG: TPM domain-containing protein [Pseudomonadota bacterium]
MRALRRQPWLLLSLLLALWACPWVQAQELLPVPPLSGRVIDQTATLSTAQSEALSTKLAAFEAQAGPQIVVLLVPSTLPEDIAAYAQRVGEAWKIGRRDVGDGLLIVVAKNDRRINIQTAKALEGAVPDLAARQIIDSAIRPAFRANDYAGGLNAAVDQLIARLKGEALPQPQQRPRSPSPGPFGGMQPLELLIFAFVALPLVAGVTRRIFGRGLGSLASGGATGLVAWLVTSSLLVAGVGLLVGLLFGLFAGASNLLRNSGRQGGGFGGGFGGGGFGDGGWSGGGGGGGGFSSGGGGDFGGGGASGDW